MVTIMRQISIGAGWLVLMALSVAFGVVVASQPDRRPIQADLDEPTPPFQLRPFSGPPLSLESLRGRPVMLAFWASWSGLCSAQAELTERVWADYRGRGLAIIAVATHDYDHNARVFARVNKLTFAIGLDPDQTIARRFGLIDIPQYAFIDGRGHTIRRHIGALTEAELRANLDELLRRAG